MGKIVFLDIDGTLVDFHQRMPDSTQAALQEAKENGHKMVLCTGRTYTNIYPWLLEFPFDAVIASAGAYIQVQQEIIYHHTLNPAKVSHLVQLLQHHHASCLLQGINARYVTAEDERRIGDFFASQGFDSQKVLNGMTVVDNPASQELLESVMYFEADTRIEVLQEEIKCELDGYFTVAGASFGSDREYAGELTRCGETKSSGMKRLIEYLGMRQEDTVAVGDGPNDFEMIDYAAVGVVMENGIPELKKHADYITSSIDEDGIYNAFQYLGLVK